MKLEELINMVVDPPRTERRRIFLATRNGILLANVNPLTGAIEPPKSPDNHLGAVEE